MSSRDSFLARVRRAADQGRQYRVHALEVPAHIGYLGASGDLCERLAADVNGVGGQAFVVPNLQAACQQLQQLFAEAGAQSAVCWNHELLDRMGVASMLDRSGIAHYDYDRLASLAANERRRALLGCDIGITSCDCAIAETGTLMMCSAAGQERLASLLPPMHVAIVERRQIVPDLIDAFVLLTERAGGGQMTNDELPMTKQIQNPESKIQNLPSNVTFITGPSKTGDIELQLTTGVHGPGKWRVIIIQ